MVVASSYPFLDVFWTILIFFVWVACASVSSDSFGSLRSSTILPFRSSVAADVGWRPDSAHPTDPLDP